MLLPDLSTVVGLNTSVISNTELSVAAGSCLDAFGKLTISLLEDITIDSATTGINGLDTGTIANSTWYYVYVIRKSTDEEAVGAIISLSNIIPALPANYDCYRKIGVCHSNSIGDFDVLNITSDSNFIKIFKWETPVFVLTNGSEVTFTPIDLSDVVPPLSGLAVQFNYSYTADANGNYFSIVSSGITTEIPSGISTTANVPAENTFSTTARLVMGAPTVDYLVQTDDLLSLSLNAFQIGFMS